MKTLLIKNLPKGWNKERLALYGKCIRGVSYAPKDLRSSGDPASVTLLRSNNIKNDKLNLLDLQVVSTNKVSEEQLLKHGDIFICMSNGSKALVGKNVFIEDDLNYTVGAFCSIFRFDHTRIYPLFVKQLFLSEEYRKQIADSLAGTSINNLKNSHIEDLEFLIPPYEEQKKISEALSLVDLKKQTHEEVILKIDKLKKGLMSDLLSGKVRAK